MVALFVESVIGSEVEDIWVVVVLCVVGGGLYEVEVVLDGCVVVLNFIFFVVVLGLLNVTGTGVFSFSWFEFVLVVVFLELVREMCFSLLTNASPVMSFKDGGGLVT